MPSSYISFQVHNSPPWQKKNKNNNNKISFSFAACLSSLYNSPNRKEHEELVQLLQKTTVSLIFDPETLCLLSELNKQRQIFKTTPVVLSILSPPSFDGMQSGQWRARRPQGKAELPNYSALHLWMSAWRPSPGWQMLDCDVSKKFSLNILSYWDFLGWL